MNFCLTTLALASAVAGPPFAAPPDPDLPVFKITVRPAAAPSPALRYKLLPEVRDQQPGNALVLYYKALSPEWMPGVRDPKVQATLEAALEMPADQLRTDPGVRFVQPSKMLEMVDQAARRSYIDWELVPALRRDGIALLLPDAQQMRTFGQLLAVRARLDAADGKFDRSVSGLATGFALARHLCEAPTFLHALIGAAVASRMLPQVEALIQQPGTPNLYWALTDLPRPLIDLRKSRQGEWVMLDWVAPGVREAAADPTAPAMSVEQLRAIADRVISIEGGSSSPAGPGRLLMSVLAAQRYPDARDWLLSRGWTAAQVDALPVAQVALMYEVHDYERHLDDVMKWQTQPPAVALEGMARAEREFKREMAAGQATLGRLLLPATTGVYRASLRVDRRIAALRCIEAVRLYAAAHGGKLPDALADITEVPVPPDPTTGRSFEYAVRGDAATLTAPPYSQPAHAGNTFTYELTLAK